MQDSRFPLVVGGVLMSGSMLTAILSDNIPFVAIGIVGGFLFGIGIALHAVERLDEEIRNEGRSKTNETS